MPERPRFLLSTLAAACLILRPALGAVPADDLQRLGRDLWAWRAAGDAVSADHHQAVGPVGRLGIEDREDMGPRLGRALAALRPLLAAESRPGLDATTAPAVAALESYREWLRARAGGLPAGVAVGREAYLSFLRQVALLPYTPEQILAMGRQERARAVAAEALEARRNRRAPGEPALPALAPPPGRAAPALVPPRGQRRARLLCRGDDAPGRALRRQATHARDDLELRTPARPARRGRRAPGAGPLLDRPGGGLPGDRGADGRRHRPLRGRRLRRRARLRHRLPDRQAPDRRAPPRGPPPPGPRLRPAPLPCLR